jgi:hypothetical protein
MDLLMALPTVDAARHVPMSVQMEMTVPTAQGMRGMVPAVRLVPAIASCATATQVWSTATKIVTCATRDMPCQASMEVEHARYVPVGNGYPEGVVVSLVVPNNFALQDLVTPALAPKAQAVARHVQMQHHRLPVQLVQGMHGMVRAVRHVPAANHGFAASGHNPLAFIFPRRVQVDIRHYGMPKILEMVVARHVQAVRVAKAGDVQLDHFAPVGMGKRTARLNTDAARPVPASAVSA